MQMTDVNCQKKPTNSQEMNFKCDEKFQPNLHSTIIIQNDAKQKPKTKRNWSCVRYTNFSGLLA